MEGDSKGNYLDDDEASTAIVGALEVDGGLVVGNVEALDCGSLPDVRYLCVCGGRVGETQDEEDGCRGEFHIEIAVQYWFVGKRSLN